MRSFAACLLIFLFSSSAFAHKLLMEVKFSGEQIRLEAFFEDDFPAEDAIVQLVNDRSEIVQATKTDHKGIATFQRPLPGKYQIKIDAIGHIESREIDVPETMTTGVSISGPTREEQTRTPWDRIGLGVGIILGTSLGWFLLRRKKSVD